MTKKVLIADDSVTIQKFISLALAGEDISTEFAASGDRTIEKVKSMRPDLVFVDALMPVIDGFEICSLIKEDPELADTRVVLMIGTFESFDEAAGARAKCDAHLTKPFNTSELIQLTHSLMAINATEGEGSQAGGAGEFKSVSRRIDDIESPAISRAVSTKTRESFLGSKRILDLFEEKELLGTRPAKLSVQSVPDGSALHAPTDNRRMTDEPEIQGEGLVREALSGTRSSDQPALEISEEVIDRIVDKVVRRMSPEVIREIAWEVVPELSDVIIRQSLEERGKQP